MHVVYTSISADLDIQVKNNRILSEKLKNTVI